jgi:hypothetical protein
LIFNVVVQVHGVKLKLKTNPPIPEEPSEQQTDRLTDDSLETDMVSTLCTLVIHTGP